MEDKIYYRSSPRPGNLKRTSAATMLERHPERILEKAVTGMLPGNTLGRAQARKLFVYADGNHQHAAQLPQLLDIESLGV